MALRRNQSQKILFGPPANFYTAMSFLFRKQASALCFYSISRAEDDDRVPFLFVCRKKKLQPYVMNFHIRLYLLLVLGAIYF